MSDDSGRVGLLDRLVDFVAGTMDALGLNGTRLRWKWNRRRQQMADSGAEAANLWRSTKSKHKMCPSCRALVPRGATTCDECGRELATVRAPGVGRMLSNLLPGASAATSLILLVNGFWFAMMTMAQMESGSGGGGLFSGFGGQLLFRFGSGWSDATLLGQWWRIVTPIFLHGGLIHFFFNSYVLLQVGPIVEEEYGTERFWVMYLLCGIAGSAASQFARPVNTVGASGALMGMMGLLLVYGWRRGGPMGETLRNSMFRWVVYVTLFGLLVPRVDNVNHFGGLAMGALLAMVVPSGGYRTRAERVSWEFLAIAGVLLVLFCFYKVAVVVVA